MDVCLNNADCIPDSSKNGFRCVCKPGYYGDRCDVSTGFNRRKVFTISVELTL